MPITITLPQPLDGVTPGAAVSAITDIPGPLPSGSHWHWQLFGVPDEKELFSTQESTVGTGNVLHVLVEKPGVLLQVNNDAMFTDGQQVILQAVITDGTNAEIDSGSVTTTWHATTGLGVQIVQEPAGTGGGLTDAQAVQLTNVDSAVSALQTVADLVPHEISDPAGSDFVSATLPTVIFGVLVRVVAIPDGLTTTPGDPNYFHQTLCAVQIFRGSDLWQRYPIHTPSRLIDFQTASWVLSLTQNNLTQWLLDLSLQVTTAPGVLVRVFLLRLP